MKKFTSWEDAVRWVRNNDQMRELVFAAYYDDPLSGAAHRYWASEEWSAVRAYFPAQRGVALDVGAGRGIASYALAKDGFSVIALEPDASELVGAGAIKELADITGLPITINSSFAELLPFDDASFDVVFARAVLHHSVDLKVACREFHRVLRPGGRLIAVREHVISRRDDLPAFFDKHPLHSLYGGENAFLLEEYRESLKTAGFNIVACLAPFDSPINYAPHTLSSLLSEVAVKVSFGCSSMSRFIKSLLTIPVVWGCSRRVLNLIDRRPGRLYSFILEKI